MSLYKRYTPKEVQELRNLLGLSVKEMAEKLGVSLSTLTMFLYSGSNMSQATAKKFYQLKMRTGDQRTLSLIHERNRLNKEIDEIIHKEG